MNAELKAKWVEALRSGEYQQGKKRLKHMGRYCCLGVLAHVAGEPIRRSDRCLSTTFERRIGLDSRVADDLAVMNDVNGKSFPEIAAYIEANL